MAEREYRLSQKGNSLRLYLNGRKQHKCSTLIQAPSFKRQIVQNMKTIEEICIKEQKPVFITKNGNGQPVIMSQKLYEEQLTLMELYETLDEAEAQSAAGVKRIPHVEVMARLRARLNG